MAETEASLLSTVTAQVAVFVGSLTLVTVMVVVPGARAVTRPVSETLATKGSELTEVTFLFEANSGATTTRSRRGGAPTAKGKAVGSTEILATGMITVNAQRASLSGFDLEVASMMTVPMDFPVTVPSSATAAMLALLEVHVNDLSVAFSGVTVGVSFTVRFTSTVAVRGIVTPSTATVVTVTVQAADLSGFDLEVTLMTAVPGDFPVTVPSSATAAMSLLLEVHVTDLSAAFSGVTVGVSFMVRFTSTVAVEGIATPSTAIGSSFFLQEAIRRRPMKAISKFFMIWVFKLVMCYPFKKCAKVGKNIGICKIRVNGGRAMADD